MKKSSAFLPVILLLLLSLLTACGGTKPSEDASLHRVKEAGKLLVAVDTTYPPMEFIGEDNKTPVGFDVDLAKALADKLGIEAEFVVMDWDGIISGLQGKRYDVIISSMSITPERSQQVDFVEYAEISQLFVSGNRVDVKRTADLAGKTVAVQAETNSHIWMEKAMEQVPNVKLRSFKAATDAFLEVKHGKADLVVIDEPVGLYYAKKDPETYRVTGRAQGPEPIGVALRKEDKALKAAIQQAIQDLKEDGTYMDLSKGWFGKELGE